MKKKCLICGNEFNARDRRQKLCSDECRKISFTRYKREYNSRPEVRKRNIEYMRNHNPRPLCKICGKPIIRDYSTGIKTVTQMHDECVYADVVKTLKEGKQLNTAQYQRLASRGYGLREFREEWNV